jgi:hypothetical protein
VRKRPPGPPGDNGCLTRGLHPIFLLFAAVQYGVGGDCGGTNDASVPDAGGPVDSGQLDAGRLDAGPPDSGQESDAATADAGHGGGGGSDAGVDAGDPCAPLRFVQAVPGTSMYQVMRNTNRQSWTINLTPGNFLIAMAYFGQGPGGGGTPDASTAPNMIVQVSDNAMNAYSAGPFIENGASHYSALQIFFAANVTGGATTVTVTADAGTPLNYFTGLLLEEYAGIASTAPVDFSTVEVGSTPTLSITAGAGVATAACDMVLSAFTDGNVPGEPIDAGSGWTFRSTDLWDPGACFDDGPRWAPAKTISSGTIAVETNAPSNTWVATQIAFRSAASAATPQPTLLAFSTLPQTLDAGTCSTAVTVGTGEGGVAVPTGLGVWVNLSGNNPATFFVDPACRFPADRVFVGAGTHSVSFYFEGGGSGALTLSAAAAGFSTITQVETLR